MKSIFLYILILSVLGCARAPHQNDGYVHSQVKQNKDSTWTYRIYLDSTLFIQQDHIPGLVGWQPFKTKKDAQKTAKLVVEKLIQNQKPYITHEELVELGIRMVKDRTR